MASAVFGMIFLAFSWFLTNMRNVERSIIYDEPQKTEDKFESALSPEKKSEDFLKEDQSNPQISI